MSLKAIQPLFFRNIKNPNLSLGISHCDLIIIAERYRTDVVIELRCFIYPGYLGRTTRPHVEGGIKSHGYLIAVRPIQQI
jgi:hypothetical protein